MRTFYITTLGCKVNQYESEQIAALLRAAGLRQTDRPDEADLRIVNSCSVTVQAASKSRQAARQFARLAQSSPSPAIPASRTVVVGCWATSDPDAARSLSGVHAALTHRDNLAAELQQLLSQWQYEDQQPPARFLSENAPATEPPPESKQDLGWIQQASTPVARHASLSKSSDHAAVKVISDASPAASLNAPRGAGTRSLPQLSGRQSSHQRAFLKIQDGCDAHCTYCIIPTLRCGLWSRAPEEVVEEARQLIAAGHREIVLTGICLSAYGYPTALRRRQRTLRPGPLADLVRTLCTRLPDLLRLRLSSLEPGDVSPELLATFRAFPQVVPHFHLPLQSGSDRLLRRMNRQYAREDYLRMLDQAHAAFDQPALTTDIIVGFPGEDDAEFAQTLDLVDRARFIHIHAFPFSPRPGTAAARWQADFVRGPSVNNRINILQQRALSHSQAFRQRFLHQPVELLVERSSEEAVADLPGHQHGRCPRYFSVHFPADRPLTGRRVRVRIDRVDPDRTLGTLLSIED